jgi:hypothetical protein
MKAGKRSLLDGRLRFTVTKGVIEMRQRSKEENEIHRRFEEMFSKARGVTTENPRRVKVWDGSGDVYLGEGNYVGDVTVYFVVSDDGNLLSTENAEVKPVGILDEQIVEAKYNPKIILDDGKVVYGCQVWWKFIDESKTK